MRYRTKQALSLFLTLLLAVPFFCVPAGAAEERSTYEMTLEGAYDPDAAEDPADTTSDPAGEITADDTAEDPFIPDNTWYEESLSPETVSGGEIPDPPTPASKYTIRLVDDAAHGYAQLFEPTEATQGKLLRSYVPTSVKKKNQPFVRRGYRIAAWHLYKTDPANGAEVATIKANELSTYPDRVYSDLTLVAEWSTTPYAHTIVYNLCGGYFKANDIRDNKIKFSFTVTDPDVFFPEPAKEGCVFEGFYEDEAYTIPIAKIPAGSYIDSTDSGVPTLNLYAKWKNLVPGDTEIRSLKYSKKGTVALSFDAVDHADAYEISYSTSSKFKKSKTASFKTKNVSNVKITNLTKGKYSVRVRAVCVDSAGGLANGKWSKTQSVKVKSGVKEVKAKKGKIKLKKVRVSDGKLLVSAKSPKRLKSSDASYYLVSVDPVTEKVQSKLSALPKTKSFSVTLPLKDEDGKNLIQGKYAIAIKSGKKYKVMSSASFIDNPEDAAVLTDPFPEVPSKKGLQGSVSGRVHHTFGNFMLNDFIDVDKEASNAYKYNGKTYYFKKVKVTSLTGWAKSCNRAGIVCTGQFMLTWPGQNYSYLVAPGCRNSSKTYFLLNGTDKKARETWEALFTCIAENMAEEGAHLDNWILGNEVNVGNEGPGWFYHGDLNMSAVIKHYASVYRCMYYAVRSNIKNARIYICTDHTFNDRNGDWGAKQFMTAFNSKILKENKNINWNLAYHAYPSILTSASTWNDGMTTDNESSEFVTPKNLNVLTSYVRKHFGTKTRIILSEQGFTAVSGENVQAAAVAYTYYKAEFNDMIDAVIFRSEFDEAPEVKQGLAFGLSNRPKTWQMFTYMDSPKSLTYTTPYLSVIPGATDWGKIIPGWDPSKFQKME